MTGKLDRLEEQGLIQRVPDPTDRRAVKLRITDSGRSLIDEAFSTSLKVYESMLNELSRSVLIMLGTGALIMITDAAHTVRSRGSSRDRSVTSPQPR